jgi:hypothetical protein
VVAILVGLAMGIWAYDRHLWQGKIPADAKIFSLTAKYHDYTCPPHRPRAFAAGFRF